MISGNGILLRRRSALPVPGIAPLLGGSKEFLDSRRIALLQRGADLVKRVDELVQLAGQILAIAQSNIAPHFGGARGDPRCIAKAVGTQQSLIIRPPWPQDIVDQLR